MMSVGSWRSVEGRGQERWAVGGWLRAGVVSVEGECVVVGFETMTKDS